MAQKLNKGAIRLAQVPEDVQRYIIEVQGHEQTSCLCKRSKEFTVYMLIREHRDMTAIKDPLATKKNESAKNITKGH